MKICIYCASSSKVQQKYFDATARLGRLLSENRYDVIYGGGRHGLMGCLADSMLKYGGTVHGIIPHFMKEVEWAHDQLSSMTLTDTLHERKAEFLKNADAMVARPGGCGTLEELMEVITLKRLGLFTKPIVILNTDGYYDPLRQMLERCVEENFMDPRHLLMWSWAKEPEDVIPAIIVAPDWDSGAISFALQK
ncbi:MAG: TIGR00730 family Rossman fold protein [Saprospiraceae bacterium]